MAQQNDHSDQEHDNSSTIGQHEMPPPGAEGVDSDDSGKKKKKIDPTFKRNVLIIGVALVLGLVLTGVVMMSLFSSKTGDPGSSAVAVGQASGAQPVEERGQLSPAMQEALKTADAREFAQAEKSGARVYIGGTAQAVVEPIKPAQADQPGAPVGYQGGPLPAGYNAVPQGMPVPMPSAVDMPISPAQQAREERLREGLAEQLRALVIYAQPEVQLPARIMATQAEGAGASGSSGQSSPVAASGSAAQPTSQVVQGAPMGAKIVDALEIVAAEIASDVDMYRTNFCSARIVAGRLRDAYLVGSCRQSDEGLSMTFSRMRLGNQTYGVQAVAMDELTSTDAMSNIAIDRRYLQRYVFPVGMAVVGGYASARARVGQTATQSANGVVINQPAATREQAVAEGVAAGVQIMGQTVSREAGRPVQITMKANSPIGIMFLAPVFSGQSLGQ